MTYRYAVFARFPDGNKARSCRDALPDRKLGDVKTRLFDCQTDDCADGIIAGLMNNSTWAESDARRGLRIGLGLGLVLGLTFGYVLFYLLELPISIGVVLGGMMGTMIGALMSGIIGAGLVHPKLKGIAKQLRPGEALLSISCRSRSEHERAMQLAQDDSLEVVVSP